MTSPDPNLLDSAQNLASSAPSTGALEWVNFHEPTRVGLEERYVRDAVRSNRIGPDGEYTRRCVQLLERELGGARVLLTTSCTHALEISAELLGLEPGDEVLVPAFAFVTTASAFARAGARPVFVDVDARTLTIDVEHARSLVTDRTRAVVGLHYGGGACDLEGLLRLCEETGIELIEDNAHGIFVEHRGRALGTWGAFGAVSFNSTKSLSCGEGGALVINTPELVERAGNIRHKGTDRERFERGEVEQYTWVERGSSYALPELQAAYLLAQLEGSAEVLEHQREILRCYARELRTWARQQTVRIVPDVFDTEGRELPDRECPHHLAALLLPDAETRRRFVEHLHERRISAHTHYHALPLSKMGRALGGAPGSFPVTESVCERLVRLPVHFALGKAEVQRVIEAVLSFAC